jgi:outer membrane lipoprotein SlyB
MVQGKQINKRRFTKLSLGLMVLISGFLLTSCAGTGRYNTQKGALAGAGIGAIAGQIIGGNTASTMIGAGSGALIGAVVGNAQDQANQEAIDNSQAGNNSQDPHNSRAGQVVHNSETPPGKWVMAPGQWHGHHWVPEHRQWVPIHP